LFGRGGVQLGRPIFIIAIHGYVCRSDHLVCSWFWVPSKPNIVTKVWSGNSTTYTRDSSSARRAPTVMGSEVIANSL
jgi:hypothetical protein